MKAGLLQMVSGVSMPHNLDSAADLLAQAAAHGAELAVLPEYFCLLGQRDTDKLDIAETSGARDGKAERLIARHFFTDIGHDHGDMMKAFAA
jgi:predicted amidohydrolase